MVLKTREKKKFLVWALTPRRNQGFTLIEVVIVVAIIAVLAAIAVPQLSAHRTRSYNTTAASDLKNAGIAQEAYYVDTRQYTNNMSALIAAPYSLCISPGVSMAVSSASNVAYLMTAYHFAGNGTYTLSGPGGNVVP